MDCRQPPTTTPNNPSFVYIRVSNHPQHPIIYLPENQWQIYWPTTAFLIETHVSGLGPIGILQAQLPSTLPHLTRIPTADQNASLYPNPIPSTPISLRTQTHAISINPP
ncbi:hypothetical protein AYI68_g7424, partial [Smittium mucronatum]